MTDPALSPSVHPHHSSPGSALDSHLHRVSSSSQDLRRHSSPSSHDLNFPPLSPSSLYPSCGAQGPPSTASTSSSGSQSTGAVMMQSPSGGDVYLDGPSGALTGLDSMPLVAGVEGRVHSPALSDLVAAGTLLPWSPRSADSMMAQSPTIQDALSANIGLDVAHSSDSLCDSSTPFPGLFSMEGDAASVSSSASEDLNFNNHQHHQVSVLSAPLHGPGHNIFSNDDKQDISNCAGDALPQSLLSTDSRGQLDDAGKNALDGDKKEAPWRFEGVGNSQSCDESDVATSSCVKEEENAPGEVKQESQDCVRRSLRNKPHDRKSACSVPQNGQVLESSDTKSSIEDNKVKLEMAKGEETEEGDVFSSESKVKEEKVSAEEKEEKFSSKSRRNAGRKRRSNEMASEDPPDLKRLKEEDAVVSVNSAVIRARHASSNSDCSSSSGTAEQLLQPVLLDTLLMGGAARKRRGGAAGSRESSVSSRGESPAPDCLSSPPMGPCGGMTTRRASSRDSAKKKRCSCCTGDSKHSCCSSLPQRYSSAKKNTTTTGNSSSSSQRRTSSRTGARFSNDSKSSSDKGK